MYVVTSKVIFIFFNKITILPFPLTVLSHVWLILKFSFQKVYVKLTFSKDWIFEVWIALFWDFESFKDSSIEIEFHQFY